MFNTGNIMIRLVVFIIITGLCSYTATLGKAIYVNDDSTGANDGSSWENAFNYLQDALAVASDGDEIRDGHDQSGENRFELGIRHSWRRQPEPGDRRGWQGLPVQ